MRRRFHPAPGYPALTAMFATMLAFTIASSAFAAPCPASRIFKHGYSGDVTTPTFAASLDTTVADTWSAHIHFDKLSGQLGFDASSSGIFTVELRLLEELDVVGVPLGTPVEATLVFEAPGYSSQTCGGAGCGVGLEVRLVVGADSLSGNADQSGPGNQTRNIAPNLLVLPIHFVAGVPVAAQFVVRYGSGPGAGGAGGHVSGVWRVAGLPRGIAAISCSGGNVTPIRSETWGRLKVRYR